MASDENYLDQLLADANDKMNKMENDDSLENMTDDFVSQGEEELEEFMKQYEESSDNEQTSDSEELTVNDDASQENTESEIPQEEILDMDDIDSLLADISEVHPERNVSAEELNERLARYEENPEEAEKMLMNDEEPSEDASDEDDKASSGIIDDDFLSGLEDVDALLQSVEEQARLESEEIQRQIQNESDSDIADINDILSKSDNNEAVNDDLLSMIEGMDADNVDSEESVDDDEKDKEETPSDKKKNKKKKNKKNSEEKASSDEDKDATPKKGLLAKLKAFIFESDEDENDEESEDSSNKKGSKKNKAKADDNAAIEAELEAEDKKNGKKKKDKKDKKEKKEKKEKKPKDSKVGKKNKEEQPPEKPGIKTGGIVLAMAFCITLLVLVLFLTICGSRVINRNKARVAYYKGDYTTAANLLYKMKLSDSDELIFEKASVLSKLELYCNKADSYKASGDRKAWLDALFEARQKCDEVYLDAKDLNITEEVDIYVQNIEKELNDEFGLSPDTVAEICGMKPLYYTYAVENIIEGKAYNDIPELNEGNQVSATENNEDDKSDISDSLEDLLPEEEAILNGMETEE